ncbi:MAG: tyrosine-type recombinase/integrase [Spirochaetales bacterium]|uniref:Tyrosine-type recombinase/integrase n=1 Tax=Candidatus Thalassospirochaeta sargassi TaxID=3119039 RepID=A0AAJ1MKF4_9SPIO|nr:tyrosine-type recombinase/integrase [Spirochaetales bacterium]
MRYREPFTLYLRKLPSGKKIWYYQTYDKNNKRTCGFSTGTKSKTAAKSYCYDLLKRDALIPERLTRLSFNQYSETWWLWDKCEYLSYVRRRKTISESYASTARNMMEKHILPYFGKKQLKEITSYDIEKWLDTFAAQGLSNSTARLGLAFIKIMFKEAVRRQLIINDPAASIKPLKVESVTRGVLTQEEVTILFAENKRKEIWTDDIYYYGNILSACTGMRMGEIMAVRGEILFDDHILVDKQYTKKFGLTDTKSHHSRKVIIPDGLMKKLKEYAAQNSDGYIFSIDGGKTPVHVDTMRRSLFRALKEIGINDEERRKRNISFHSWRHYLNTAMRSNNIADGKLRAMIGHSSSKMTEHYTHFDTSDFKDIQKVQNNIINFAKVG